MAEPASHEDALGSPATYRIKRRLRGLTPLLVWCGVLIVAVALYSRQNSGFTMTGFAEEVRYNVASETAGRLQRIEVELHQDVSRGQIVASFEVEEFLLQLQEARTELDRMAYELGRGRALWEFDTAELQVDQQTNLRRFARDVSNAHIDYLAALTQLAEDRIRLQGLELTLSRTRQLAESETIPLESLDDDRIAFEALAEKVAGQESTVDAMLMAYRESKARHREFIGHYVADPPDAELLLRPLESGIKIQEIRIEMVNLAIGKRVLRAPADGRVVETYCYPGEVVAAYQPVLSILEPRSTELVADLPKHQILELLPGSLTAVPGEEFEISF